MFVYGLICLGIAAPDADALVHLLNEAVKVLGPRWTVVLLVAFFVGSLINKWLAERRKEQIYERVEKEKDRTIKRLSDDNLELRMILFKEIGHWNSDDVMKVILQNRFEDSIDPRHVLQGENIARKTNDEEKKTPKPDNPSKREPEGN